MKKFLIILTFLISTLFFVDNVSAKTYIDTIDDDYYYIAHKWVGSPTMTGNGCYYFGLFDKTATITVQDYKISSANNITYYKFCNYDDFISFLSSGTGNYDDKVDAIKTMQLNEDSSNVYYTNFDIIDENGNLYFAKNEYKPNITITKDSETTVTILEKEYITDVTLNIEFSLIDNDNYLYMYKYGIDSEWTTITLTESTSLKKTYSENNTLYVQVLDREDNSVIAGSTYTVSSINYNLTPYITIDEITAETCILGEYTICQSLQINSHIADFSKYSFVIIDHTQNTTEKYTKEMTVYKTYYTNSTIEVRIIENETNSIFQTVSFTINTIDEETDNLDQYIKQECFFASIGTNYLCNYYFYNYKPDVYQYYYGTSTSEFEELKLETGTESVFNKTIYKLKDGLGKLQEVSYSENTTVYFKILNKETGEVIHTQTFVISYSEKLEDSGKKDIFDIFKNFNNNNSTIKELIDNIWTLLKTSSIYEYIMILIVGALIIVIIKAANR